MKIAVTGASGHVGVNLCRQLIAEGHQVKALVHEHKTSIEDLEFVQGSLQEKDSLRSLVSDCEIVFHLAAIISIAGKKDELIKTNVEGTQNLLEVIKESNIRRLVHFSSIHALSHFPLDKPMDETRPLVEESPMYYEITKSRGENLVHQAVREGLDAVIINPTAIMGPFDFKPSLLGQVLIKLYKGTLPALVPGGYNWVDVRDVVQGAIAAMEHGRTGERYILSGHWKTVEELALLFEKVTGRKTTRFKIPMFFAKAGVPFITAYAKLTDQDPLYTYDSLRTLLEVNTRISHEKATKELGYKPRSLEQTIKDTITWYQANGYLN